MILSLRSSNRQLFLLTSFTTTTLSANKVYLLSLLLSSRALNDYSILAGDFVLMAMTCLSISQRYPSGQVSSALSPGHSSMRLALSDPQLLSRCEVAIYD